MVAFRIFGSARPVDHRGPLQPMSPADAYFWRNRERASAEREARKEGKRA